MNQDRSTRILFAAVFIGAPAFYVFWRITPYLLFYLLPFVLFSGLLAAIWRAGVVATEEDNSWLALFIPLTAILVFLLLGFPKVALVAKTGKVIESLFFYRWFNNVNSWFEHALWSVIPNGLSFLAPTHPALKELYDLNDVRWILWVSLGIGAPVTFLLFSGHKARALKQMLEEKYQKIAADALQNAQHQIRSARTRS